MTIWYFPRWFEEKFERIFFNSTIFECTKRLVWRIITISIISPQFRRTIGYFESLSKNQRKHRKEIYLTQFHEHHSSKHSFIPSQYGILATGISTARSRNGISTPLHIHCKWINVDKRGNFVGHEFHCVLTPRQT